MRLEFASPIEIETKAVSDEDDHFVVTGYASTFGNRDLGGDVVVEGAFKKSLKEHGLPLLCWNHKIDDVPLGAVVEAKEDRKGLWFKAELPRSDSFVATRIVPQLKRRGGLKGVSIGYRPTLKEMRKSDGARLLKEIHLFEISFVPLPMNQLAGVESVKSLLNPDPFDPIVAMNGVVDELLALGRSFRGRG